MEKIDGMFRGSNGLGMPEPGGGGGGGSSADASNHRRQGSDKGIERESPKGQTSGGNRHAGCRPKAAGRPARRVRIARSADARQCRITVGRGWTKARSKLPVAAGRQQRIDGLLPLLRVYAQGEVFRKERAQHQPDLAHGRITCRFRGDIESIRRHPAWFPPSI
jgi:hypothetical protein